MASLLRTHPTHKGRVLLVEENVPALHSASDALRRVGFRVDYSPTVSMGAALVALNRYDLLVCDLMGPGKSGLAFAQAVRAGDAEMDIILTCTAMDHALENDVTDLGIFRVLVKPVAPELLSRIILHAVWGS